jgi:hypothetical protein
MKIKRKNGSLMVDKAGKQLFQDILLRLMGGRNVKITNEEEHRIALEMIRANFAEIVARKNYGHLEEIKPTKKIMGG